MGGQIQHDMGAMNVGGAGEVGGVGGAGGSAFEQEVAQLLGVDAGALSGALRSGEQAAAEEIAALSADGEYSAADRQQVEANMIDRVIDQLGIDRNSLTNEQMMALTNLCRECLAGVENQVLGQNGLSAEQSLFAGNDNLPGLGAVPGLPGSDPLLEALFTPAQISPLAAYNPFLFDNLRAAG